MATVQNPSAGCDADRDFTVLIEAVRQGSEDAAWKLVERYGGPIRRAVRRALSSRLRTQFDSLDFVQLVWSSFFRMRAEYHFERPDDLVAFLLTIARNKVVNEVRRRLETEKYDLGREQSLEAITEDDADDQPALVAPGPGPINVAIAREQWNRFVAGQPEHLQPIVRLRLQGLTYQEIAEELHVAKSLVRRCLSRLAYEEEDVA